MLLFLIKFTELNEEEIACTKPDGSPEALATTQHWLALPLLTLQQQQNSANFLIQLHLVNSKSVFETGGKRLAATATESPSPLYRNDSTRHTRCGGAVNVNTWTTHSLVNVLIVSTHGGGFCCCKHYSHSHGIMRAMMIPYPYRCTQHFSSVSSI